MIDFSNYKFRCHQIGGLMTNQRGKKDTKTLEEISETAKAELIKIYVSEVYGRDKELTNKFVQKGLMVEEDSLTLLSRVKGRLFFKNDQRFENDFLTGEPDTIEPELIDIKSSWDIHTFFKAKASKLDTGYDWQIQGYMDLVEKDYGIVAHCLIDTPDVLIETEKQRLFYKMNAATVENPEYLEACEALEKEMKFGDIPIEQRIHQVRVDRDCEQIHRFYDRVPLLRDWLNDFASNHIKANTHAVTI